MNLFKHQEEGVDFLVKRTGAILADEMGLGKTRQAIVASHKSPDSAVIVCPASLKHNWAREIRMVDPLARICVISAKTEAAELEKARWIIVNYDILGKWVGPIELAVGDFTLVGDEAHYIKGKSARSKFFLLMAERAQRVYLLTGTPIMNRPAELYNLLIAVRHPMVGYGKKVLFEKRYCGAFMQSTYSRRFWNTKGATNLPELREKISTLFLRRLKSEVMDLPEKIIEFVPIEMTDEFRKKYDSAFSDYLKFVRENPIVGRSVDNIMLAKHIVELQKLKQVCSESKEGPIMEAVDSIVEADGKVVIFTQYQKTLMDFMRECASRKIGYVFIDGSVSPEDRQKAVDKFQNDDSVKVFIGNIKAAGVGITLTAASQVIFADLDWTPASHDQAMDRCHRIGQTGTVNVRYFFVKDSVEEDIISMLESKREVVRQVMEGGDAVEGQNVADVIGRIASRG